MTYEIQIGEENFAYFYEKMYLPYISKRHGEEAWIEELDSILKSALVPALLVVKEDDMVVGASLINFADESIYLMRLGLMEGNEEFRKHGVIGAIYYFGILEGQKTGCRYLNVGGTHPFLTDGLTRFKLGLGAELVLELSPTQEYQWLGINKESIFAREFLSNNPFMHVSKDFKLIKSGT